MLAFRIAWRNIFRQKRRTVLTALAIFGGFTLSSLSIGWADGTYNRIINMFTRNRLGHIQIHAQGYFDRPSLYKQIHDYGRIGQSIAGVAGVLTWAPRVYSAGLASVGDKSAGVRIIGIDPVRENDATRFDRKIVNGSGLSADRDHEVVLGKTLATLLKADIGDSAVIVTQGADGSLANDIYRVVGVVDNSDPELDQTAFYLNIRDTQDLLVLDSAVHEIIVIATKLSLVDVLTREIHQLLATENLEVLPWQVFAHSFYVAMQADKEGAWVMLFVIVLIVAIGVFNTVLMMVLERTREYGVLRAIGTSPLRIFQLVMYESAVIGCIGVALGFAVSLALNYFLSLKGIPMPTTFTYGGMQFSRYFTEVNARSFYIPGITVLGSTLLISILPGLRAARVEPARALRAH